MAQQSILGRITQLARANINSLLDSAEDPRMMLDQMIRDYTEGIREAEQSVAGTIGNLRMMEEDAREAEQASAEWGGKASAASKRGDEMRATGNTAEADRFDGLARVALQKQLDFEQRVSSMEPTIVQQREVVEKLKTGLEGMRYKLRELQAKRDELVARSRVATAQQQVQAAVKSIDMADPTQRAVALRGPHPSRGSAGAGPGRAGGVVDGSAVRHARRHGRRRGGRVEAGGAQGRGEVGLGSRPELAHLDLDAGCGSFISDRLYLTQDDLVDERFAACLAHVCRNALEDEGHRVALYREGRRSGSGLTGRARRAPHRRLLNSRSQRPSSGW